MIVDFFLGALAFLIFSVGMGFIVAVFFGRIPSLPTMPGNVREMIRLIRKYDPTDGDIADIGCGYGSVLFALSRTFPNRRIVGYEFAFLPYLFCRMSILLRRRKNVRLVYGNAFTSMQSERPSFSSATCYLSANAGYAPRIKEALGQNITHLLAVNGYPLPDLSALEKSGKSDPFGNHVYAYAGGGRK